MGAADLVHALGGRMHGTGGMCRCPAHDDATPSLSVTERDGRMLVHCQAGCSQADVIDALATRGLDIRRSGRCAGGIDDYRHPTLGRPSSVWPYRDADGRLVGYAARFETNGGKAFRPLVRDNGRWRVRGLPKPYPLFRLPDLIARPDVPVLIVEGEKAAHAAGHRLPEMVAITSMHGAKSPRKTDWSPLKHRTVTVWPDADAAGAGYADTVARLARDAGAASVRVVALPHDLPAGWDLADEPPHEGIDLEALVADAPEHEITSEDDSDDDSEFEQTVSRLAALQAHVYDRRRADEAARLGVRTVTLDEAVKAARASSTHGTPQHGRALEWPEPEPWPEPVAGAALLTGIADLIKTYVSLPSALADTVALWVVMTWLHAELDISTFLNITSATKRCGKTLLMDLIGALVHRPMPTSNVTAAALFRIIEHRAPTLPWTKPTARSPSRTSPI